MKYDFKVWLAGKLQPAYFTNHPVSEVTVYKEKNNKLSWHQWTIYVYFIVIQPISACSVFSS